MCDMLFGRARVKWHGGCAHGGPKKGSRSKDSAIAYDPNEDSYREAQ